MTYTTMTNEEAYKMILSGDMINTMHALFRGKNYAKDKLAASPFALKLKHHPTGKFFVRYTAYQTAVNINMPYKIDTTSMKGVFETDKRVEAFDGAKIIPIEYFDLEEWIGYLPDEIEQKIKKQLLLKRL